MLSSLPTFHNSELYNTVLVMILLDCQINAVLQDGRLQAGDQLLAVNGHSLVGVAQET